MENSLDSNYINLLVEPTSRFGDGGIMLPPSLSIGSMKRVLVGGVVNLPEYDHVDRRSIRYVRESDVGSNSTCVISHYPSLIRCIEMSLQRTSCANHLTYIGFVNNNDIKLDRRPASLFSIPVSKTHSLVSYVILATEDMHYTLFANYENENSVYTFADIVGTELSSVLLKITRGIISQHPSVVDSWQDFVDRAMQREHLEMFCDQAHFIVGPDGPHFNNAAFHTSKMSTTQIIHAVENIGKSNEVPVVITFNTDTQYLKWF